MNGDQELRIRTAANISLIVGGIIVACWGLYVAQNVLAPTVLALVFGVVLSPLSDLMERIGLPRSISALLSLIFTLFLIALIAGLTLPVAQRVFEAWPLIMSEVRSTLYEFQAMLQGLEEAGREVSEAVGGESGGDGDGEDGGIGIPSTADALFLAPAVLGQTITFAGVLFFFLLTRGGVYAWLSEHIAPEGSEREMAARLKLAEREVARYFLTISLVNLVFGICVTIAMTVLGVPSPILWGIATALLNFILYLGPAIVFFSLGITGLVVFDGAYSLVPALTFLGFNLIEAQFVTPTAIGKTMQVNPLLIFLALVFFLWLWGPLGGFVSIPLLLWGLSLTKNISQTRRDVRREVERHSTAQP